MSSRRSRRKFLLFTGALAAGCYGAGFPFPFQSLKAGHFKNKKGDYSGLESRKPEFGATEQRIACAIGVGRVGLQAIDHLRQNQMISETREIQQIIEYERRTVRVHSELKIRYVGDDIETAPCFDQNDPLFLIGSSDDPSFHMARDFVKSCSPDFLLTSALAKKGQVWPGPSENESILTVEAPEDIARISRIILHLYALIARPGLISVDFTDVKMVLGGGMVRAIEYRPLEYKAADMRDFLVQHSKEMGEASGIACIFSFGAPYSIEPGHYEAIIDAFSPQIAEGGPLLLADDFCAIGGAFELLLLCRTEKLAGVE